MGRLKNRGNPDRYLPWLIDIVGDMCNGRHYLLVLSYLHSQKYTWRVPNDDNRNADGLELRREYGLTVDYNEKCTLLEMIIALAERYNYEIEDYNYTNLPGRFWELIENMGLLPYDDESFSEIKVSHLCQKMTLLPLKGSKCAKNDCEIWYQLQYYIAENWDL